MAGSIFGKNFTITTWGESHGKALGVVIDGCPAGLSLVEEDIQKYLDRRKPGQSSITTMRKEDDLVQILSGVFENKTTGTPISLMVQNTTQRSSDYSEIANYYRPGHADYTFDEKYGFRDYRGGGRSSGRETIGRVASGAIAAKMLEEIGVEVHAFTRSIGPVSYLGQDIDYKYALETTTCIPDAACDKQAIEYLNNCKEENDSAGGVVECHVHGLKAGIGEPVFDKLDAQLAKALMSIGAVKAVEIGDGCAVATAKGSENNDAFYYDDTDHCITKKTNHSGGTLGGMSDGDTLIVRAYIKPTPSIFTTQSTVNKQNENIDIQIKGRHDPVIVPRAVVVVESMVALTLADLCMENMHAKMSSIKDFYQK